MALLICTMVVPNEVQAKASKKKMSISSKKITLEVGQSKKLKVKGTKKKVKWSSSKKKIATVTSKGVVKAKKNGTCKITAKVSGKKLTCTVRVIKKKKNPTTEEVKDTETTTETTTEEPKKPSEPSNPVNPVNPVNPTPTPSPSVDNRMPYEICSDEGHVIVEITTPATCSWGTCHEFKCSRCGAKIDRKWDDDALGHDYVVTENIEATCEKDGRTVKECTRCGKDERKNNYKTGHDLYTVERKEATCGADGYYVEKCRHEGCTYEKRHTLAKKKVHEGGVTVTYERNPYGDHNCSPGDNVFCWETKKVYSCAGCGAWINTVVGPAHISREEYIQLINLYGTEAEKYRAQFY